MPDLATAGPPNVASAVRSPVSRVFTTLYVVAYGAYFLSMITPMVLTLALKIERVAPADKENTLALVLGTGAVTALIANPVAGLLSDRTTSRAGQRRPWLIGGAIGSLSALALVGTASTVPAVLVGWCVAQIAFCCAGTALTAILPDQYPAERRGRVSGLANLGQALAIPLGLGIAQLLHRSLLWSFVAPAAVGTAALLLLAAVLPDRRAEPREARRPGTRGFLGGLLVSPRRHPDFAWAWLGRLLIMLAFSFVNIYAVYFLSARFGFGPDEVAGKAAVGSGIGTIAIGISSVLGGVLSDRLGRRKVFVAAASVIYGLAVLAYPVVPSFGWYLLAAGVASFGIGMYFAVDLALVTEVLPNRGQDAGKDLALLTVANRLPDSVTPVLAPLLLAVGDGDGKNYTLLFGCAALIGVLGALSVFPIRGVR